MCMICSQQVGIGCNSRGCGRTFLVCGVCCGLSPNRRSV
ncbi:hypothetical protein E2C01_019798 [Portunus trituberculatus]|uniref:Uncharacterized protein n=1 Tax=Portunus trituberculatus TaxID=210409 RepID=A0A5B7DYF1_PORTR|nr:hypothetical protein [Portunus trituberculatus]